MNEQKLYLYGEGTDVYTYSISAFQEDYKRENFLYWFRKLGIKYISTAEPRHA